MPNKTKIIHGLSMSITNSSLFYNTRYEELYVLSKVNEEEYYLIRINDGCSYFGKKSLSFSDIVERILADEELKNLHAGDKASIEAL